MTRNLIRDPVLPFPIAQGVRYRVIEQDGQLVVRPVQQPQRSGGRPFIVEGYAPLRLVHANSVNSGTAIGSDP